MNRNEASVPARLTDFEKHSETLEQPAHAWLIYSANTDVGPTSLIFVIAAAIQTSGSGGGYK